MSSFCYADSMLKELIFPARQLDKIEIIKWKPEETAVVIVDMWDKTICKSAEARVIEIAPKINNFIKYIREQGVLIIHAPHGVMKFYQDTMQRELASSAPYVKPPVNIDWQEIESSREGEYPVDDKDWCDDTPKCSIKEVEEKQEYPWSRQIESIDIMGEDAVSDNGQEIYNLLEQRGIKNLFITGVHINACVLGRPYGIRQMVKLGKNVALVRDLTDGLYDPRSAPFVSHKEGVELLIKHVEKYWCPSVESSEVVK